VESRRTRRWRRRARVRGRTGGPITLTAAGAGHPFDVLYDVQTPGDDELPPELAVRYGGRLGFPAQAVYSNFVSSVDGVIALPGLDQSSQAIAGHSEDDRFVMGLLRACADAVLIGAGTLAASPRSVWTAERINPRAADAYAELRRARGRTAPPLLAVLTGRGRIDPAHPGLAAPSIVLTSERGAAALRPSLPRSATVVAIGDEPPLDPAAAIAALRERGCDLILCEGGPTVFGALVERSLVDELFLTLSPLLAGRADAPRPALVEGVELLPGRTVAGRLLTLRRAGSHLFLRYDLRPSG
jgi:riboflavin biosynthesis pyrimidine reductase